MTDGLLVLIAYLLGSVSGSLWLGRLRGVDIRTQGSGNAGGTNAFRTQGAAFALGTVLVDIGKGMLAVGLAQRFGLAEATPWLAGAAAVAGHVWPVFHGFRGGKGAATLVGALGLLWPLALLPLIGTWLVVLVLTGYVGLSTVLAGLALPLFAAWQAPGPTAGVFAVGVAVFLAWTHRSNLQRLRAGTEHRFAKARLLHRLWRAARD